MIYIYALDNFCLSSEKGLMAGVLKVILSALYTIRRDVAFYPYLVDSKQTYADWYKDIKAHLDVECKHGSILCSVYFTALPKIHMGE